MVPENATIAQTLQNQASQDIEEVRSDSQTNKPEFVKTKNLDAKKAVTMNVEQNQIVQMKRIDKPSAIQLINEDGLPEAYLDSVNTGVVMFRERKDYSIFQITEEKTNKPLAYIGGYALQISFNMEELNTMERIEECLEGLKKLFRHQIMHQPLNIRKNQGK